LNGENFEAISELPKLSRAEKKRKEEEEKKRKCERMKCALFNDISMSVKFEAEAMLKAFLCKTVPTCGPQLNNFSKKKKSTSHSSECGQENFVQFLPASGTFQASGSLSSVRNICQASEKSPKRTFQASELAPKSRGVLFSFIHQEAAILLKK
jgi:hypothetical protein